MKNVFTAIFLTFVSLPALAETDNLLPNPLPVYTDGEVRVLVPMKGLTKVLLPIDNSYTADPGCYIVCYSHDKNRSVYAVAKNVFVVGQIRVPGNRQGEQCVPLHNEGQVVSQQPAFKELCRLRFSASCRGGDCWGGSQSW